MEIDLVTSDGVHIKCDFYDDLKTETGVILIPMLGRTKETWASFAPMLREKGYKTIAIDPRGHGRSQLNWQSFTSKNFNDITNDIRAAKDYLSAHGSKKVAIIGASIGANLALKYAAMDSEVKTVVLLSPGIDFRGVKPVDAAKQMTRPFLIVASEEDAYSFESSEKLESYSAAEDTKFEELKGAGHGTEMLSDKKLPKLILSWLAKYVK